MSTNNSIWDSDTEVDGSNTQNTEATEAAYEAHLKHLDDIDNAFDEQLQCQYQEFLKTEALKRRIWNDEKREKCEKKVAAKAKRNKIKKLLFDRKLAKAKKGLAGRKSSQGSTIDSSVSSPVKPPAKKKKTVHPRSSKKLPTQANKMTSYYKKSVASETSPVSDPQDNVSLKMGSADVGPPQTVSVKTGTCTISEFSCLYNQIFVPRLLLHHIQVQTLILLM